MSRNVCEMIFTLVLLIVVASATWEAQAWGIKARLFPWAIGIPLMGLLVALLVTQLVRHFRSSPAGTAEEPDPVVEAADAVIAAQARRRGFSIVGWMLGFLVAIWLLGFPLGGTLGTLAYLKLAAHEKWPISIAISAGTAAFFALMINVLNTPFPKGALFELFAA